MTELASGIYTGTVFHRRHQCREHSFAYRVFMVLVDVDRPHLVTGLSPFWSCNKRNIASLMEKDFLPAYQGSLRQKVASVLEEKGFAAECKHILLLANWRYFGYLINPISCFYCLDDDGHLSYLLLEVTNTPWGERQVYVLPCEKGKKIQDIRFDKAMHVSPFYAMDMQYRLKADIPAERLMLHLDLYQHGEKAFDATLQLQKNSLSKSHLFSVLLRYPFMTLKVAAAIYWQALKLFVKKVPVQPHPLKYRKADHENK